MLVIPDLLLYLQKLSYRGVASVGGDYQGRRQIKAFVAFLDSDAYGFRAGFETDDPGRAYEFRVESLQFLGNAIFQSFMPKVEERPSYERPAVLQGVAANSSTASYTPCVLRDGGGNAQI